MSLVLSWSDAVTCGINGEFVIFARMQGTMLQHESGRREGLVAVTTSIAHPAVSETLEPATIQEVCDG